MKRFLYKDAQNRTTEANNFEPSDFIDSFNATFGLPVKTNGSGVIDPTLLPSISAAATLQITRIASETLVSGDCVYAVSSTHVGLANNTTTEERATVLGIAINNASAGQSVGVVLLGAYFNSVFSVFPLVNKPLYLDTDGGLTDVRPASPGASYLTSVAISLGANNIFIRIDRPIRLI